MVNLKNKSILNYNCSHHLLEIRNETPNLLNKLVGNKSLAIIEMFELGIPIPPGFIITEYGCRSILTSEENSLLNLLKDISDAIENLHNEIENSFNNKTLLLSFQSGNFNYNPGIIESVFNIGCNDQIVDSLLQQTNNVSFAYDTYHRLIKDLGCNALGIPEFYFEDAITTTLEKTCNNLKSELNIEHWKKLIFDLKTIFFEHSQIHFPDSLNDQIKIILQGLVRSWNSKDAVTYRETFNGKVENDVSIIMMSTVLGDRNLDSVTGFAFSRNIYSGENKLTGEYWINTSREEAFSKKDETNDISSLKHNFPEIHFDLEIIATKLERCFKDVMEIEFIIENGSLWVLESRKALRSDRAAIRLSVEMVEDGLISKDQAILQIEPKQLESILHETVTPKAAIEASVRGNEIATGLNVSPGVTYGRVVFSSNELVKSNKATEDRIILVLPETKPDDVPGILAADGILTSRGGRTSHAALVARHLGKPAIIIPDLEIDLEQRMMVVGSTIIKENDFISIDGSHGKIYIGKIEIQNSLSDDKYIQKLLSWADDISQIKVWANIDGLKDVKLAQKLGAAGVGLCRTEHIILHPSQLPIFQKLILSETMSERQDCLSRLQSFQKEEFKLIFQHLQGMAIIIRLIDSPLHEFLPNPDDLVESLYNQKAELANPDKTSTQAEKRIKELEKIINRTKKLYEKNPMLGLRGARLGIKFPDIFEMQLKAIFISACEVIQDGREVNLGIMIPMVIHFNELKLLRILVEKVANEILTQFEIHLNYKFGTMIETPRAALTAGEMAKYSDFFSFGTNDLTQTTCAISRDDIESSLWNTYMQNEIFESNPFETVDNDGVGKLIKIAIKEASTINSDLVFGVCGEHAGDPKSTDFYNSLDIDYLSCSPFQIPVTRLSAAHSTIKAKNISF